MENAAEAFKMAFAVLVFVIAMSLGFMMISQARATADVVYATRDKQDYVTGITAMKYDSNQNYRIVGIDTVIPTIYRYAQENYAVTIINKSTDKIEARFDLQTEDTVSSEFPTRINPIGGSNYQDLVNNNSSDKVYGLKERIEIATGINGITEDYETMFERLYKIEGVGKPFAPWTASKYKIMQRLKKDISGGSSSIFFNSNINADGTTTETNEYKGVFGASGLMGKYGAKTFKEYYYTVKEVSNLTNEEEVKKLEIIYVVNY